MRIQYTTMDSPVGPIAMAWRSNTVLAVFMQEATDRRGWDSPYAKERPLERLKEHLNERFEDMKLERGSDSAGPVRALRSYFRADANALDRLDVDPGGTRFQSRIWKGLRRIPLGRTMTYGELAKSVGSPGAARAAGGAVGANPVPLIIPCHRIIGSDGRLTGFGGGLARKKWLLRHEGAAFRED